ncbi:hypothetical protein INT48_007131 [Thamnidium elegans]|uniref:CBS domain-containing protein n=1 Tax=Thamnidium elegans TaxID=101142 RepID=A0A8H7SS05_9FUNG|nr:hypothetical protein INT48_007131 [Thamnidium elegans]
MSVVSPNKNKPGRPSSSISTSTTVVQSNTDSDMLSVSSRQRQSKKDEVKEKGFFFFEMFINKKKKKRLFVKKLKTNCTVSALRPAQALTVRETILVIEAAQLMAAKRSDCVLVVDDEEHLSGIFTAKDLAYRVVADNLDARSTTVADIMTKNPVCVTADTSAQDALNLMVSRGFRHLVTYERFTGNQIAKIYSHNKKAYDETVRINLVSSLLATLLLGSFGPMDAAEGSGTNMMNINSHQWDRKLLEQCGGESLYEKLYKEPVEGGTLLGNISHYYVERYGFHPECRIMPFTGDNSATLVSMNLSEGDCVVSLGTSDTVLVYLKKDAAEPTTESHLMAHPTDPEGFMGMLCYKNGSLAREFIRDSYANGSWDEFNEYLNNKEAMQQGDIGFYYWMQEIIPFAKGIYRFEQGKAVKEFKDKAVNVKAIVESQFMSMNVRLQRMGGDSMKRVLASGGAAANANILQLLSNILGLPVYRQKGMNGASLGGALLAKFGTVTTSFEEMMAQYPSAGLELICSPDLEKTKQYASYKKQFSNLEKDIVQNNL